MQPSNFTPIVTVNLTSLLVLTTLFIGIFKSLPNTAYIKLIDVWLICCLLMPFCEVLLHTSADFLRNRLVLFSALIIYKLIFTAFSQKSYYFQPRGLSTQH